jgi:hypothetical protein
MAKITKSFVLDDQEDVDLIRWLDGLPKNGASRAIREMLRAGIGGITLDDLYQKLLEIERKLGQDDVPEGWLDNWNKPPDTV